MKRKILMTFGLLAGIAVGARAQQTAVTAREGTLELPTYVLNAAETAPIFERDWSYQRARRSVYPYALDDNMTRDKKTVSYKALYLENEYVELCVLPEIGGRLLFIGEVLDCCTFMHGVEERFGTDYVLTKEKIRYVVNGEEKYMYGHDFKGLETTYRRVKEILDPAKNEIVTGKIGDAACYLIDAKALLKRAEEKLRENQHWFVVPRE